MKKILSATLLTLLTTASAMAATPLTDSQMSETLVPYSVGSYLDFQRSVEQWIQNQQQQNQNLDSQQIVQFLQNQANIFGLRLENVSINGVTYIDGAATLVLEQDGQVVSTVNLPAHIDSIIIGAIRVNGNSPMNASFGSIAIRDISLTGTVIYINTSSTSAPPGMPMVINKP
jgi:hypothetical protein